MNILEKLFLEFQARFFMVDAYLAELRDDKIEAATCEAMAYNCRQQIALINLRMG